MAMLEKIHSPEDIKGFDGEELESLCEEMRRVIIDTVSANGGHLASNLGVVELTVALGLAFSPPRDTIVWDVGHQSYPYKLLTGRYGQFHTIRTEGGLAGFPCREESPYDLFTCGHSSTSISSALGVSEANYLQGKDGYVVAVIGDGALTGGLAYEGLNNAGRMHRNLIVILNDNTMSISKNVGSMARYLSYIRTKPGYIKTKNHLESSLQKLPVVGPVIATLLRRLKRRVKRLFYNTTIFEDMGFAYYGPFDGHNIKELAVTLETAKLINKPVLLHVRTYKGKGYQYAEQDPTIYHGLSGFDVTTGDTGEKSQSFSDEFGQTLCCLARENEKLCAITAAMQSGTGLGGFREEFRSRFFDVGISEEHAVTFAGGLAAGGMLPVFAVYSTFLQRAYDELIHDVSMQGTKIILAIDRAGAHQRRGHLQQEGGPLRQRGQREAVHLRLLHGRRPGRGRPGAAQSHGAGGPACGPLRPAVRAFRLRLRALLPHPREHLPALRRRLRQLPPEEHGVRHHWAVHHRADGAQRANAHPRLRLLRAREGVRGLQRQSLRALPPHRLPHQRVFPAEVHRLGWAL